MRAVRRKAIIAATLVIACYLGSSMSFWLRLEQEKQISDRLTEIRSKVDATERLLDALLNVETGARGYSLTQQVSFLEPYWWGLDSIQPALQTIKKLYVGDNKITELINLTNEQIGIAQQMIAHPNDKRYLQTGKTLMDTKRQIISELQTEESVERNRLISLRLKERKADVFLILFGLISVSGLLWVIITSTTRMVRTEERLQLAVASEQILSGNYQEALREEERLGKIKNQLITTISHELRTPLTILKLALIHLNRQDLIESQKQRPNSRAYSRLNCDALAYPTA